MSAPGSGEHVTQAQGLAVPKLGVGLGYQAQLRPFMEAKPSNVELVLSGRNAHERIIAAADLVTEMREVKHYYKAGVPARTGIEK